MKVDSFRKRYEGVKELQGNERLKQCSLLRLDICEELGTCGNSDMFSLLKIVSIEYCRLLLKSQKYDICL